MTHPHLELMHKSVKGMKLALTYDFNMYTVDPEVEDIVDAAAKQFEQAGAIVEYVDFNFIHTLDAIMYCWAWAISVDTALDLQYWKSTGLDLVKDHRDELPEEFIFFNEIAANAGIVDMRLFNEIRTDILDAFEDILSKYDAIISPTAVCKPLPASWHGKCIEVAGHKLDPSLNFISFGETPFANFIGYPAASIPAGLTSDNLPIGMQIIGKQYHDEDVFALSKTFETLQPWRDNYKLIKF